MTTNYVSIKSVLYDLSLVINERFWNENQMLEWAYKALRLIRSDSMLVGKLATLNLIDHKAELPDDFKYLIQIMYQFVDSATAATIDNMIFPPDSTLPDQLNQPVASMLTWKPMRLTSNPYHASICLDQSITACPGCTHSFSVSNDLVITSTLQAATIMVAYLGYPTDPVTGEGLIPDNEELKEAILYYLLYRYWMAKYNMMEDGADSRMKNYLSMWNTLSKKAAGNMNLPDVNEMENIKNIFNRLVPRENQFANGFLTLTSNESRNF